VADSVNHSFHQSHDLKDYGILCYINFDQLEFPNYDVACFSKPWHLFATSLNDYVYPNAKWIIKWLGKRIS